MRTPPSVCRVQLTRSVSSWTLPAGTVQALLPLPGRSVQIESSPAALYQAGLDAPRAIEAKFGRQLDCRDDDTTSIPSIDEFFTKIFRFRWTLGLECCVCLGARVVWKCL